MFTIKGLILHLCDGYISQKKEADKSFVVTVG